MMDSGKITKWRDMACSHGLTVEDMRVNILMIKKKVKEFSTGLMAENMKEIGKMGNNTASEYTHQQPVRLKKESGAKEKELIG